MDHEPFDRIARIMGAAGSRRASISALLGMALTGLAADAAARTGKRRQRGQRRTRGSRAVGAPGRVAAEAADCLNPGPSTNLKGCDFQGDDLSGADLFSSNLKEADFRNANLCGADLSSSNLKDADFRNANLTRADFSSSNVNGARFDAGTTFCQTVRADGSLDDRDCPDGETACCFDDDCPPGTNCVDGLCALPTCSGKPAPCSQIVSCGEGDCECFFSFTNGDPAGQPYCVENVSHIFACEDMTGFGECTDTGQCDPGFSCVSSCCNVEGHLAGGFCWPVCGNAQGAALRAGRRRAEGGMASSQSVR